MKSKPLNGSPFEGLVGFETSASFYDRQEIGFPAMARVLDFRNIHEPQRL
jgi:hypothetical protein